MSWRKVPQELIDFLEEAVSPFDAQRRTMFGCPCFFTGGNMFAGAHQESILLRLSAADRHALRKEYDEVVAFEPTDGRPMREYLLLPEALSADTDAFHHWLAKAHAYAASLPPKPKKQKRTTKKITKKTSRRRH